MPVIHALGATVEVDLGDAVDPAEFAAAWSRCLVEEGDTGGMVPAAVAGPRPTMTSLTQAITHELISQRRGELLMLHAGAVCNPRTGDSIAYVAPGGTGKTTLSRLLGKRFGYLTDETVGIDPATRRVHAYPKPLSMRTPDGGYPKRERSPDELGLVHAHTDPHLTTLALLRRSSDRPDAAMTRLDLFDAITSLVPETSSLSALDRPLHVLADLERAVAGVWLLEYSEAEHILEWVADRLGEG
jgi:hypothetical protein